MTYLMVAIGSGLGGVFRYWLSGAVMGAVGGGFPWGTLVANLSGSFAIGLFAGLTPPDGHFPIPWEWRQFLMAGVCGGYTTFSTFSLETLDLMQKGAWGPAALNILASVALCLFGVWLGHQGGVALVR